MTANFLPHWYCFAGDTRLLWTTGDLFIGLSYVAISATPVRIIRRAGPDLPYQGYFWDFGLFIISCGVTHGIEILTVWQPVYWLGAAAKILTAVSSLGTAIVLAVAVEDIIPFVRTARQAATGRGQERFRALFMTTPLAVVSLDLDVLVTSWNPAAEETIRQRLDGSKIPVSISAAPLFGSDQAAIRRLICSQPDPRRGSMFRRLIDLCPPPMK